MKITTALVCALALSGGLVTAQETKKVPKDSVRVIIPGCTKGYIFTAGPRTADEAGSADIPQGTHLRMNAPKKMMAEIKAHEGERIEITGIMKKGQYGPGGVRIGPGIRVMPGSAPGGSVTMGGSPTEGQIMIDVEGWRELGGACETR